MRGRTPDGSHITGSTPPKVGLPHIKGDRHVFITRPVLLYRRPDDETGGGGSAGEPADEQAPDTDAHAAPHDTPEPEGSGPAESSVDYEARYNNLRPQYDRTHQELSTYRQAIDGLKSDDPDTRAWAAQELGIEIPAAVPDVEDDGEEYEADPRLLSRLEALEQERFQEQQERALGEYHSAVSTELTETHPKLPAGFHSLVADVALAESQRTNQPIDINSAVGSVLEMAQMWAELPEVQTLVQKNWRKTKDTAPHISPVGGEGTQQPNLDDRAERLAWMASQLQANG